MLRYLATISLFLLCIAGYTIDKFGQDLCIYEYISKERGAEDVIRV